MGPQATPSQAEEKPPLHPSPIVHVDGECRRRLFGHLFSTHAVAVAEPELETPLEQIPQGNGGAEEKHRGGGAACGHWARTGHVRAMRDWKDCCLVTISTYM